MASSFFLLHSLSAETIQIRQSKEATGLDGGFVL